MNALQEEIKQAVNEAIAPYFRQLVELMENNNLRCLTLKQASEETGIHEYTLRRACIDGKIKHKRDGIRYYIPIVELRKYIDN